MSTRAPALTGSDRQLIADYCAELYRAGSSIRGVAARISRSYGCTHQLLVEAGTTFRDKTGRPRKAAN